MNRLRHLISAADVDRPWLDRLFAEARAMQDERTPHSARRDLQGYVLATLFYEPSTRTRFSFEAAMLRLGGSVVGAENARDYSSGSKGETLEDTARIVGGYVDGIAVRHYEEGAPARMAAVSPVPIINAGDGAQEHPSQALLDVYTIERELGRVDGLRVALVGDLANGRTVHSLCRLLSLYHDVQLYLVSPDVTPMRPDVLSYLSARGVAYHETGDLTAVAGEVDVLYQTRVQKERFADPAEYQRASGLYIVDAALLMLLRPRAIVMHPLPRLDEIAPEVDADPRAAYFRQARNGLFVRMALLKMLLLDGAVGH
jgi:aspartate carbamoyltransferase catalytic subunit